MDFNITKEQQQFVQEVIDFARGNLNDPEYLEKYSPAMWKKVSEFGILGLNISEEYGGLNESYLTSALVYEALGYACKNNGFIFVISNHMWVGLHIIYIYGSKILKDKYIKKMVEGKLIGAIAITEAESGSDAFNMSTTAVEVDDEYVLNGSKMFISNGAIADVFVVFAITQSHPQKAMTAFVVEKNFKGVKVGPDIKKMGLGACPTNELILDNVIVPKENVLGKVNLGSAIMTEALEWERCYEFAPHVGVMRRIMEKCIEYVSTRKQFNKFIGENQAISNKIADMKVSIEMSRLLLYKIAWLKDQGKKSYLETSIFKLYVSENYIKSCREAIQMFGAYGYCKEYELERELRDALACSIYSGTNEMQKNTIYDFTKNLLY